MPGLDGFAVLEACRADPALRTVPIIVITAKIDRAAARRGMELGAADFITKPFTEDEVLHSIAARLEKKELLDELDAFAHTVAHDLKNPLATLCGRIEVAAMMLGRTDEAALRHHLEEAAVSARRLGNIIEELLVLSGVRQQAVKLLPLDTAALVAEALDRLEGLIRTQQAVIQKPDTWPAAAGHGPWVVEVWANYLGNAAKYAGPGARIELGGETRADGRTARFWVRDHGPGLPPGSAETLFVPFTRIGAVRAGGHGLGLSIVRRIVEKLGGSVGAENAPGGGALFWFELPASPPPAAQPAPPPALFAP